MNALDLGILALLAFHGFQGLRKGFFRIALDLVALGVGVFVGLKYYPLIISYIEPHLNLSGSFLHIMAFLIGWGATFLTIMAISMVINRVLVETFFNTFNRVLGLGLGVLKGVVLCLPFVLPMEYFQVPLAKESALLEPARPVIIDMITYFDENETFITQRLERNKKTPEAQNQTRKRQQSQESIKNVMERNNLSQEDLNKIWSETRR